MRPQIPTARIAGPALERAAAEAKRGLRIAGVVGAHLVRAMLIVLGFGLAGWFATANSPSTHKLDVERIQHIVDATVRDLQWRYDLHRTHLWDLMSRVEDIPHGDSGSAAR